MTIAITRNVPDRFRGFLASAMCEVTPGVYTSPGMTRAVRERVWKVMEEWFDPSLADQAVVMTWPDAQAPGGQAFLTLGIPKVDLQEHDGMKLVRCALTKSTQRSLTIHAERNAGSDGEG